MFSEIIKQSLWLKIFTEYSADRKEKSRKFLNIKLISFPKKESSMTGCLHATSEAEVCGFEIWPLICALPLCRQQTFQMCPIFTEKIMNRFTKNFYPIFLLSLKSIPAKVCAKFWDVQQHSVEALGISYRGRKMTEKSLTHYRISKLVSAPTNLKDRQFLNYPTQSLPLTPILKVLAMLTIRVV